MRIVDNFIDTYLYISRDIEPKLLGYLEDTERAVNFYYTVQNNRTGIKITFAIFVCLSINIFINYDC